MRRQVVHYNDLARPQSRAQDLFYITEEDVAIGRRLDGHGCHHTLQTDSSQQCQGVPVSGRRAFPHPFATQGAAIATRHLSGHAALVEKNQLLRIDLAYLLPPCLTPQSASLGVLLTGVQRFFYAAVADAATTTRPMTCSTALRPARGAAVATPTT